MKHSESLEQVLSSHFGKRVQILRRASLSGGSIHHAERLETSAGTFFVKHNHASHHENFLAEVDGLERLRQTRTLRVPQTILVAQQSDVAYLVLEYLDAHPPAQNFWEHFGESLAALHRHQVAHFGYERDNFIGALVQRNTPHSSWSEFFIEERLSPMMARACEFGLLSANEAKRLEQLFPKLEQFFLTNCLPFCTAIYGAAIFYQVPKVCQWSSTLRCILGTGKQRLPLCIFSVGFMSGSFKPTMPPFRLHHNGRCAWMSIIFIRCWCI